MNKNESFTLIELLVVVAIIAILMAILFPSLKKARDMAKRAVCIGNLKQIGVAQYNYASDYDGFLPSTNTESGLNTTVSETLFIAGNSPKAKICRVGRVRYPQERSNAGCLVDYIKNFDTFFCPARIFVRSHGDVQCYPYPTMKSYYVSMPNNANDIFQGYSFRLQGKTKRFIHPTKEPSMIKRAVVWDHSVYLKDGKWSVSNHPDGHCFLYGDASADWLVDPGYQKLLNPGGSWGWYWGALYGNFLNNVLDKQRL